VKGFFDFVKSLGAARLAAMSAVTLALVGFFSFLIIHMTTPQMVPLFTDLSMEDSAAIAKDLDRQGVSYEIKNNGAIILVPSDKVARLRMKEAESGLPKGGGVGYEIFDKSDALGATNKPMMRVHTAGSVGGSTALVAASLVQAGAPGAARGSAWSPTSSQRYRLWFFRRSRTIPSARRREL